MKSAKILKKEIKSIPFQLAYEEGKTVLDFKESLGYHGNWLLPQALALVAKMKPVKNAEGKFDATQTVLENIDFCNLGSDWTKGLLFYLSVSPRGKILPKALKATSATLLPYAANVPLFLAAFKKYQGIPYSAWDLESCMGLIDHALYQAITADIPSFTKEQLLEFRQEGCRIRSGENIDTYKSPLAATSILPIPAHPEFDELPRMAKIILCQIWVAHPIYWHEYMISDLKNLDNRAAPLIETELVMQQPGEEKFAWDVPTPPKKKKVYVSDDLPWDA